MLTFYVIITLIINMVGDGFEKEKEKNTFICGYHGCCTTSYISIFI